jgi:hypothetical protein
MTATISGADTIDSPRLLRCDIAGVIEDLNRTAA